MICSWHSCTKEAVIDYGFCDGLHQSNWYVHRNEHDDVHPSQCELCKASKTYPSMAPVMYCAPAPATTSPASLLGLPVATALSLALAPGTAADSLLPASLSILESLPAPSQDVA